MGIYTQTGYIFKYNGFQGPVSILCELKLDVRTKIMQISMTGRYCLSRTASQSNQCGYRVATLFSLFSI